MILLKGISLLQHGRTAGRRGELDVRTYLEIETQRHSCDVHLLYCYSLYFIRMLQWFLTYYFPNLLLLAYALKISESVGISP